MRSVQQAAEVHAVQWQPLELDFAGPLTSEDAERNPFTDTRLLVTFTGPSGVHTIRGFYAADGDAAETGADSGTVWRVRFMPEEPGEWRYSAELRAAPDIALSDDTREGERLQLANAQGGFRVVSAPTDAPEFYVKGTLRRDGHLFRFANGDFWLKGGANSPENLLAYADFDGTYRQTGSAREGEAAIDMALHRFEPHSRDWREGDPIWRGGKGKALIGAVNYLADQGMNAVYMLAMNVGGDGNDVWPWRDPDDPTRFDVSKLAQWNIVFTHMQRRGIAIHLVTQETENELMLDGGDTGRLRQLYYRELIARFAHHPALFWNLGEENGPVHWMPEGQSDEQRIAMARFVAKHDPYNHPILLHTHSEAPDKDRLLTPLLGEQALDGLSFQVSERETVNFEIRKWHALSNSAAQPWAIGMDEIGMWHTGARADADDPTHDSLRRHALWGALLAGGAGVEWYFGARQQGNDLTTEDWRSRAELWRQTRIALEFFEAELPYWNMQPCPGEVYCLGREGEIYAYYLSAETPPAVAETFAPGTYAMRTFDPLAGRFVGGEQRVELGDDLELPQPWPDDRVVLLKRVPGAR